MTAARPIEALLIGAGNRGRDVYAAWAKAHPDRLRIVGVAEPDAARRASVRVAHGIAGDRALPDWKPLLDGGPPADVAIVATSDTQHTAPTLAALERGLHVLLEKPIAPTPAECLRLVRAAEHAGRVLQIAHVLRHTPFYRTAHEIVASGRIGRVLHVDLREHVAHWHMAHSYVRGRFRNTDVAAPFLLAKSCHDLDLLVWLAGARARRVASFGSRDHYRAENAPPGAPERCTDGCPVQERCPHDAVRFYLSADERLARHWPWNDVSADPSLAARRRGLETGNYGRCVYRCDNDVCDHQVVSVDLDSGATATLGVHGLATHESRTLRISGSLGELRGRLDTGQLEVTTHGALEVEARPVPASGIGHFGGDEGLMEDFTSALQSGDLESVRIAGRTALEGHLLGFAAEQARLQGRVVTLADYASAVEAG